MSNKGYANNYYVPNRIGATKQYNNNTQVQINIPQRGQKITFATIARIDPKAIRGLVSHDSPITQCDKANNKRNNNNNNSNNNNTKH